MSNDFKLVIKTLFNSQILQCNIAIPFKLITQESEQTIVMYTAKAMNACATTEMQLQAGTIVVHLTISLNLEHI